MNEISVQKASILKTVGGSSHTLTFCRWCKNSKSVKIDFKLQSLVFLESSLSDQTVCLCELAFPGTMHVHSLVGHMTSYSTNYTVMNGTDHLCSFLVQISHVLSKCLHTSPLPIYLAIRIIPAWLPMSKAFQNMFSSIKLSGTLLPKE